VVEKKGPLLDLTVEDVRQEKKKTYATALAIAGRGKGQVSSIRIPRKKERIEQAWI